MKEIKLSNGKVAVIKEGKGRDLFWAYRNATDPADIIRLLITRLITINGEPVTEDTLDELPIQDAMLLIRVFTEFYSPLLAEKQLSA